MSIQLPSRSAIIVIGTAGTAVACAAGSPVAMIAISHWLPLDWPRLSDIGQAYGLASAFFSALAVAGVAASFSYQAHSVVVQRDQDISDAHFRLLSLVLTDPGTFGPVLSDRAETMSATEYRRFIFVTLAFRLALSGYETGHHNEHTLRREVFRGLFLRDVARRHWRDSRAIWLSATVPSHRRFAQIADEEFQAAVARGPARPMPPDQPPAMLPITHPDAWRTAAMLTACTACFTAGAAAMIALRRIRRR